MATYEVTMKAIVHKTYTIEADSESAAVDQCWEIFSVLSDEAFENYKQEFVNIESLEGANHA